MPHDIRDAIIDFINHWRDRTTIAIDRLCAWLGIRRSKFYEWSRRYGTVNEHNGNIPRDFWLEPWERRAIVDYHDTHPLEGYRRLAFMMLDDDVAAASPSTVYRVLKDAGRLDRKWNKTSSKGTGFVQPIQPHEHWHVDIAYINVAGTFYYLTTVLDGCSRAVVHWELREAMTEQDIEVIVQRAIERIPGSVRPRIISDNGPQFVARDFKEFIRIAGLTHVRTAPYCPQSNGKLERYHRTIKSTAIRTAAPESIDDARRIITRFVTHYNEVRLHSAIGYVTPRDRMEGRHETIQYTRDRKLEAAREARRHKRAKENAAGRPRRPMTARSLPPILSGSRQHDACHDSTVPGEPFAGRFVASRKKQLSDFR